MKDYYSILILLITLLSSNFTIADDKGFALGIKPMIHSLNTDETSESGKGIAYIIGFKNHNNISFRAELGIGNITQDTTKSSSISEIEADYIGGYLVVEDGNDWAKAFVKIGINRLFLTSDSTSPGALQESEPSTHLGFGAGFGIKATQSFAIETELSIVSPELTTASIGILYIF